MDSYQDGYGDPYHEEEQDKLTDLPGEIHHPAARGTLVALDINITSENMDTRDRREPRTARRMAPPTSPDTMVLIWEMSTQHQETMANMTKLIMQLAQSQKRTQQQLMATQTEQKEM